MKRIIALMVVVLVLSGCSGSTSDFDQVIALRNKIMNAQGCTFESVITADYGDKLYTFRMQCNSDINGAVTFVVTAPDTISGVTGVVSKDGGKLTFDDQALVFELLADGQISPVSAPWLMIRALRSGYINACSRAGDGLYIRIDDSYVDDALQVEIWTDEQGVPIRCEFIWSGKRIVTIDVKSFAFL